MSWTKSSENGYIVAYEDITTTDGAATDVSSSVIGWLKPGLDFVIIANSLATDCSGEFELDVDVCNASNGTFVCLKNLLVTVPSNKVPTAAWYDVDSYGESPWYKLRFDMASASGGQTVRMIVMQKAT